jgi:hypothetical protein
MRAIGAVAILIRCALLAPSVAGVAAEPAPRAHPPALAALAREFREWRDRRSPGIPDYGTEADTKSKELPGFRKRLAALDLGTWSVHDKVDFLVLQIEMDDLDFDLNIIRQPRRNPNFYVTQAANRVARLVGGRFQTAPGITVPYAPMRADAIVKALDETSAIVDQAASTLTEAVPEMADMAIQRLENVRQNYGEFARLVAPHVPEATRAPLTSAADRAGTRLEAYRQWLQETRPRMTTPWYIGRPAFDWYVKRVFLLPYDSDSLLVVAASESARNWAFLQFERQKNRHLPDPGTVARLPGRPPKDMAQYSELKDATDVMSRLWAESQELFTRPGYVGPMRIQGGASWIEPFGQLSFPTEPIRPGEKLQFTTPMDHWWSKIYWEAGHRRDPGDNHPHSDYPGHTFEGAVSQRTTCDLRRGHNSRGDSWTEYMEEVQLQLDYPFVRGGRSREIMVGLSLMRAERVYTAVKFSDGSMKPDELVQHFMENVPWMEPFVARHHELWRKFDGNPVDTVLYQMGKFEIYKLMSRQMQKLGDAFNLREFHDALLATGQIAVPLAAWEMTGDDEAIKHLWQPAPLPSLPARGTRKR